MHSSTLSLTLSFDIVFWNCIHHSITLYMMKVTLVKVLFFKKNFFHFKVRGRESVCEIENKRENERHRGQENEREAERSSIIRFSPLMDTIPAAVPIQSQQLPLSLPSDCMFTSTWAILHCNTRHSRMELEQIGQTKAEWVSM